MDHTERRGLKDRWWDYLEMSEGDADIAAQVLSGWVGDHNRHNSRGDLKGGMHSISFMSRDLIKGPVNRYLKVPVAQQCSQSKTWKRQKEI